MDRLVAVRDPVPDEVACPLGPSFLLPVLAEHWLPDEKRHSRTACARFPARSSTIDAEHV
jgi:hypothetical protein